MNIFKQRILNAIDLVQGPFRKKGELELHIDIRSARTGRVIKTLDQSSLKNGVVSGNADLLPLDLQLVDNLLHINLPQQSVLRNATFVGWDTIWDGSKANLENFAKGKGFKLVIPATGLWNIRCQSVSVDLYHLSNPVLTAEEKVSFLKALRALLSGGEFRNTVVASIIHASLFLAILNVGLIKSKIFSTILPSMEQQEQVEEQQQEPTQVPVAMEDSGSDFNGRGLFAAIQKNAETNFKAEDVASNLKNIKNLIKVPNLQLAVKKADTGKLNNSVSGALKSLQSGIAKAAGGAKGVPNLQGGLQVHWKSQFASESGKSARSLNEGQQKVLYEVFSKLQDRFRGCYETALLKFDEMAVTVSFEAEISSEGRISRPNFTVSGRATPDSQEALLSCLKSVMGTAKVDSKLSGIRIKNQFIFKS